MSDLLIGFNENRRRIAFVAFAILSLIPASQVATYAQGAGATVDTPADASPSPVTGVTTSLSVLGDDDGGEASLTYTWSATGPATVSFSRNSSNAAKNTTATFQASGSYVFQVVMKDAGGSTATSSVTVQVNQTSSTIGVAPAGASVNINATQQFAAEVLDQFGNPIIPTPGSAIGWTDLANTQLQNVCPPNYYQGQNYAFAYNCQNVINAWNSGIADTKRNRMIIWGGGHNNYYGNEVYSLNLAVNPPTLVRLNDPSPIETDQGACPPALADGKANTRETFNGLVYLPNVDKMWVFNGGLACENGAHAEDTWTLDMATLQWTRMDPANGPSLPANTSGPTYQIAAWDPNTQTVILNWSNILWQYNYAANSYTVLNSTAAVPVGTTGVIDPKRKLFIFIGSDAWVADSNAYVQAIDISPGSTYQVQDWSAQVTGCFPLANAVAPGLAYDPVLDRIVGWPGTGNTIYLFDPDTKTCTAQTYPNGPQNPTNNNGIYGRFQYFPALNAFAVVDQFNLDASLLRIDAAVTTGPAWQVSGGGSISASGLFTAGSAAGGTYSVTATSGGAAGVGSVTVANPPPTLSSTFLLHGNSTEVAGVANGSVITPAKAPSGVTGTVVNTGGTVNFTPSQGADGVYFLSCCSNTNNAYFKFTGSAVGNIFNAREGQISFNLQSRSSFAQRSANARYAFDVRDGSGTHQFGFITQASGNLLFTYLAGGTSGTYFVPSGTEDALFGNGVVMQVTIAWSPTGIGLFLNGTLVSSSAYAASAPNWSSASNFDVGAYEYLGAGGYDVSDDIIDEFTVSAPTASVPPAVSMITPLDESVVSGITTVSANATDFANMSSVQFLVDGASLGSGAAGTGSAYSISWNTAKVGNGFHTLTAVATDASGNTGTANPISILVQNAGSHAPITASITAPATGATLTGTAIVSVNASATAGIAGVQFTLDGANLVGVVTGAGPSYSYSWNTAAAAGGAHVLGAVVTDNAGNILAVNSVPITVANSSGPVISGVSATTNTGGGGTGSGATGAGVSIYWTTSTASDSQVDYGTTSSYGSASALNSTLVTAHSVSLYGLASATTYHYQVLSRDSSGNLAASADFIFTTPGQTLFLLHSDATEVTGLTNGSIITPTIGPSGFAGTVVANGAGSANFTPGQTGNGVYFLNCCSNTNNAYYKFTGAAIGNIFNASQGQISFYLKSRYSFAQRLANAAAVRYAFDARDGTGSGNHLFNFTTQATYGYLEFSYMAGGVGSYYAVPVGTEDALFGNGVVLQVTISWGASGANLYLNNTLVKSVPYSPTAPNWSAASNFDLGAFEYLTFGGYDVSDDVIDEFTVATGPSGSSGASGPVVSIISPANGAAIAGTVAVTANATDSAAITGVQFQLDGANIGAPVTGAGPTYTYTWNTASVSSGPHTVAAIATDTGGNTATSSISIVVNNAAPTVSITSPAAGATLSGALAITANASDNVGMASVQFQLDGANLGTPVTGAGPVYTYAWNTTSVSSGPHTIAAIATDAGGNTATTSISIVVNNTPPTVSISSPAAGAAVTGTVAITANAVDNVAMAVVQFQLDGVTLGSAVTGAGPAYTYSWNTTSVGNGSHKISAVATDTAGNTATSTVSVTISHTPPTVSVTAPSAGAVLSNTVTLTANATDNVAIAGVQFQLDGVNLGSAVTGAGPTYNYSWNTASVGNGTHAITVIATDTPGNTASASVSITIDHTPPTVSMAAPAAGAAINGTVTITANATDTVPITGVQFQLDGVNLGSAVTGAGPAYSYSWNTASVGSGTHTITAIATDAPGNTASSSVSVIVDHTPPSVSVTAPAAGTALSGTLSISANATDNVAVASVQFQLDGANLGAPLTGAGPSYTYLWNTTSVASGPHNIAAVATDTAGNTSNSSVSIIVDHIPPTVSITSPAAGASVMGAVTLTATAGDNVAVGSVQFQVDGANLGSPIAGPGPYSVAWNTTAFSNGAHTLTAIATDTANNTATSTAIAVTVVNPLLLLHSDASEVNGVSNGSVVTPTIAPAGFTGTVIANGSGSVNFTPASVGNGVYFLNCCANTNNAYYKFAGAAVGNIFNANQGQISFYLKSRYSFAQRVANAPSPRYTFDVRDGGGAHLFAFITQATYGYLQFSYMAGGSGGYFIVPAGSEDALFGNGVVLQVTIGWGASGVNLYLNNTLVKSTPYTVPAPNWTAASNFDLGAYEYLTFGGYDVSDDVIDEFSVSGPSAGSGTSSLSVSLTSPVNNATVSGTTTVSANASGPLALSTVQFTLDGAKLASVSGTGPSYTYSWNTAGTANGTHTLAAIVTDSSGNTATSGGVSVTVSNATSPVIRGVGAASITSSGATIGWSTSTPSSSQVNYGPTSSYGTASAVVSSLVTAHSIVLSGLSASTTYHYQVLSQDASGNLSSSGDSTFTTLAPQTGPQPTLLLHLDATEVSGVANASTITPSVGPTGFTGSVVANGTGSVNFAPVQVGNGVYFLNCCTNSNDAYYKFTSANVGNIFSADQGEITFYLKSRYSFAQRSANGSAPRYVFDVRDGNGTHLFGFLTQVVSGALVFTYMAGGSGSYYYVPVGTEDTLFGNGVVLQVNISWSSAGVNLYLNNLLVKSVPYTVPAPNWTATSSFDLGAYEYFAFGGYNISDDAIDEFTVWPSLGH